jgi:hypothetical protein
MLPVADVVNCRITNVIVIHVGKICYEIKLVPVLVQYVHNAQTIEVCFLFNSNFTVKETHKMCSGKIWRNNCILICSVMPFL